jgi:hypothetical protein
MIHKASIKVISIRQPFALAVVRLGKDIENRNKATKYKGGIFIHASRHRPSVTQVRHFNLAHRCQVRMRDLVFGAIIGRAILTDCVTDHESTWFEGAFGYVLESPGELVTPIPMAGQLGIFNAEIEAGLITYRHLWR